MFSFGRSLRLAVEPDSENRIAGGIFLRRLSTTRSNVALGRDIVEAY